MLRRFISQLKTQQAINPVKMALVVPMPRRDLYKEDPIIIVEELVVIIKKQKEELKKANDMIAKYHKDNM